MGRFAADKGFMKKIALLFPGQGAQKVGMGKDFFESYPTARYLFQEADDILGRDLSSLIFEGPSETLTHTRNSQTAIYVMSIAALAVVQEQFPQLHPTVCAGLSLGEYTALTASEHVTFRQCLPVVQFRGDAMNAACEATQGTMAAIFGLSEDQLNAIVSQFPGQLWAANFNCPGQTVISGTLAGVEKGSALAKEQGAKRVIPLNVHGAFHSGLMQLAQEQLAPQIEALELTQSPIDLVMNVPGDYVEELEQMRAHLISQVTHPVRWEQGIGAMQDIDLFIEIGPGRTLAGMNKQMGRGPTVSINTTADLEKLNEYLA